MSTFIRSERSVIENRGIRLRFPDIGAMTSNLFLAGLATARIGILPSEQIEERLILKENEMNPQIDQLYTEQSLIQGDLLLLLLSLRQPCLRVNKLPNIQTFWKTLDFSFIRA
jgi:hypothetical protein